MASRSTDRGHATGERESHPLRQPSPHGISVGLRLGDPPKLSATADGPPSHDASVGLRRRLRAEALAKAGYTRNMYYVYVLQLSNRASYIGSTPNLKNRLAEHQRGECEATQRLLPCRLVCLHRTRESSYGIAI